MLPMAIMRCGCDFDDMHSTGIYRRDYLAELGRDRAAKWQGYLDELSAMELGDGTLHPAHEVPRNEKGRRAGPW